MGWKVLSDRAIVQTIDQRVLRGLVEISPSDADFGKIFLACSHPKFQRCAHTPSKFAQLAGVAVLWQTTFFEQRSGGFISPCNVPPGLMTAQLYCMECCIGC